VAEEAMYVRCKSNMNKKSVDKKQSSQAIILDSYSASMNLLKNPQKGKKIQRIGDSVVKTHRKEEEKCPTKVTS
jgi:hypothetical protein